MSIIIVASIFRVGILVMITKLFLLSDAVEQSTSQREVVKIERS